MESVERDVASNRYELVEGPQLEEKNLELVELVECMHWSYPVRVAGRMLDAVCQGLTRKSICPGYIITRSRDLITRSKDLGRLAHPQRICERSPL